MKSKDQKRSFAFTVKECLIFQLCLSLALSHLVFIPRAQAEPTRMMPMMGMTGNGGELFKIRRDGSLYFGANSLNYEQMHQGEIERMTYMAHASGKRELSELARKVYRSNNEIISNSSECGTVGKWLFSSCDEDTRKATLERARRERDQSFQTLVAGLKNHYGNPEAVKPLGQNPQFHYAGFENRTEAAADAEAKLPPYCQNYPSVGTESYESYMQGSDQSEELFATCREGEVFSVSVGNLVNNYLQVEAFQYGKSEKALEKEMARISLEKIIEARAQYRDFDPNLTSSETNALSQCLASNFDANDPEDAALLKKFSDSERGAPGYARPRNGRRVAALEPTPQMQSNREQFLALNLRNALITQVMFDEINQARASAKGTLAEVEREYFECSDRYMTQAMADYTAAAKMGTLHEACKTDEFEARREQIEAGQKEVEARNFTQLHGMVRANPLIFTERNNNAWNDWFNYELAPSEMAKTMISKGKGPELVQGVKEAMALNPEDPMAAANAFLATRMDDFKGVLEASKNDSVVQRELGSGIKEQFEGLTESANNICQDKGDQLHYFPELVDQVMKEAALAGNTDEARAKIMQYQGAYCYLLRKDPPSMDQKGFTVMQGIGIGLAVIGTVAQVIPVAGNIVGTALIVGGGALTATDAAIKLSDQLDKRSNAKAIHLAGWADYRDVLKTRSGVADATVDIGLEALFFAGDAVAAGKIAAHAARTTSVASDGAKAVDSVAALRASDDVVETAAEVVRSVSVVDEVIPATRPAALSEIATDIRPSIVEEAKRAEVVLPARVEEVTPLRPVEVAAEVRPLEVPALKADEVIETTKPATLPEVAREVRPAVVAEAKPAEVILPVKAGEVTPLRPVEVAAEVRPLEVPVVKVDEVVPATRPADLPEIAREVKPSEVITPVKADEVAAEVKPLTLTESKTPAITLKAEETSTVVKPVERARPVRSPAEMRASVSADLRRRPAASGQIEMVARLAPEKPTLYDDFISSLAQTPSATRNKLLEHIEKGHFSPEELSRIMDESAQTIRRVCQ